MNIISYLSVPLILGAVSCAILFSRGELFESFLSGAREGLDTAARLLPTLIALVTAVSMFNASGAPAYITGLIEPLCAKLGIPSEIIPFLIVRPVSGGASTAMLNGIFTEYGADSFAGRCASVIMGSSDTLVYVVAVYFSSVGVKHTRHAFLAAALTMIFCVFFSCAVTRLYFGH